MNGKEMLEAMSFVDERYIADADATPKRRHTHWQGIAAAAACGAVVLAGVWNLNSQKNTAELTAAPQMEDAAVYSNDTSDKMRMMTAIPEMTVLVMSQEGNILHCTVAAPGTSGFEAGTEITVCLPEEYDGMLSGRLLVSFAATEEGGIVNALDWTQLED